MSEIWRLLPYDVGPSQRHFALSDALVRQVVEPAVWWHATEQPTLILGTGQGWNEVDVEACRRAGVRVVRRHAGGGAVFAASGVLGLDVALPTGHRLAPADVVETYRWLGEIWAETLRALDVPARLVTVEEARAQPAGSYGAVLRLACFGSLSPYEVAVGQRKLVGLAQVRRRSGVLLQCGLHLHFDAEGLAALLCPAGRTAASGALRAAALGLDECSPRRVEAGEVQEVFGAVLARRLGVSLQPSDWTPRQREHALQLEQDLLAPA